VSRALLWLDTAPPARREIVVASAFPIGSIAPADIAAIPAGIGVRLERVHALPQSRTVPDGRLLTPAGVRDRDVTFDGDRTSVREAATGALLAWPIDVEAPGAEQPMVNAAVAAVLSQRVWAAPPGRRARVVLGGAARASDAAQESGQSQGSNVARDSGVAQGFSPALAAAAPIQQPWMATAIARIAADRDLQAAGARVEAGFEDARFRSAPWQTLVAAADGRPLAAAAGSGDRLLVASAAPASDIATPVLLRAIANGLATEPDLRAAEVVPIPDATLRQWSRPASPPGAPRIGTLDEDDRRWIWLAVLCLMGMELWIRRAKAHEPVVSGFPPTLRPPASELPADPSEARSAKAGSRTDDAREKDARVA
jgi:hypothetical protein